MKQSKLIKCCQGIVVPGKTSTLSLLTNNTNPITESVITNNLQKRYIKQRKFKNVMENPFDMVEEFKQKQKNVQSLMDAPDYTGVTVHDSLAQHNLKKYEDAKAKGIIPGTFRF